MPPHIVWRDKVAYLVDGDLRKSLKTEKRTQAEQRLQQYIRGQFRPGRQITWQQWYDEWIKAEKEPFVRAGGTADYVQHWRAYVRDEFARRTLSTTNVAVLKEFRGKLIERGLSPKTCANIINSTMRAMWRDAMAAGHVETNPFMVLRWPRQPRKRPNPFTAAERDAILKWWETNDWFFYPYVYFQFHVGARPSETAALEWSDVDFDAHTVTINRSLVRGQLGATKTQGSERILPLGPDVMRLLKVLPSRRLGLPHVFVGKRGKPMSKKWAEHNWARCLEPLSITHRKFYCTRHTFITEAVRRGDKLKEIADYCGTSVAMIEENYCARQAVGTSHKSRSPEEASGLSVGNRGGNLVAGPGFEPILQSVTKRIKEITIEISSSWKAERIDENSTE